MGPGVRVTGGSSSVLLALMGMHVTMRACVGVGDCGTSLDHWVLPKVFC